MVYKDSLDPWAKFVGWFVVKKDGIEELFAFLTDALRVYNAHVVSCKGFEIRESDPNLTQEWTEFFESPEREREGL